MTNTQMAAGICILLSLGLPLLILAGLRARGVSSKALTVTGLGFALWLALTALLAFTGVLRDFSTVPPRLMLVLMPALLVCLLLSFHKNCQTLWQNTPMSWLIGFQAFRLPVEIFLWLLVHDGTAPPQMSFEGRNWDILTGISALPVAWLWLRRPALRQQLALGWNLAGLALLLNIMIVAILSIPSPFQQLQPANTFVAEWPFVWLPALLVPLALIGHLISLRQLWLSRAAEAPRMPQLSL